MKVHSLQLRVRYGETDRGGVVYYANYLDYFEVGRTEYLRALGAAYRALEEDGLRFVVTEARCRYLAPAGYDDELEVLSWVERMRPTRIDFGSLAVLRGERRPVAAGRVVLACIDEDRRPHRVPRRVAERVEQCDGPEWAAQVWPRRERTV
jgi:acyl-CoA thioester hydrolase